MEQTRNNNLSPLPVYTNRDEQQCRLPWAYGDVYPLVCDDYLLPFFFVRDRWDVPGQGTEIIHDDFQSATYLISTGNFVIERGFAGGVSFYDALPDETRTTYWVKDLPYPPDKDGAVNVVCKDVNGETLATKTVGTVGEQYTGILNVPKGTRTIWLYSYDGTGDTASLYDTAPVPRPLQSVELYRSDDTLQADLTDYMLEAMSFVRTDRGDTFYYVSDDYSLPAEIPKGTYYLKFSDGRYDGVWYSEMFSYAFDSFTDRQIVNMTWYDNGNLALGQGVIPYGEKGPTDTYYTNSINIPVSVGRPEYETEKEGDERDGFFFMEKGISRKAYKFTFFAPEYLCDALRLVPVSDNVIIYDYQRKATYEVDDIDMEVEWLEQGNYAQVTFTFHTDTVVKNLGKIM